MARSATLLELRDQVRQRADMENTEFISDSELTTYINQSIARLYNLILQAYGEDYYTISTTFSITPQTENYALPADFFKLRGVDLQVGSDFLRLRRYQFNKRNKFRFGVTLRPHTDTSYRLVGNNIRFAPVPDAGDTVRLWYVPAPAKLSADTDTFDGIAGFEEYVVVDSAIKCKTKQEDDIQGLLLERAQLKQEIIDAAGIRDMEEDTVADVSHFSDDIANFEGNHF